MNHKLKAVERFENKFIPEPMSGCWIWVAARHGRFGYGAFQKQLAHRASWSLYRGEIGDLCVLHKCDSPWCVNPDHLFLGTYADNAKDAVQKGRHKNPVLCGEKNPASKLSDAEVAKIKEHCKRGVSQREVGAMFGVAQSHVSSIVNGKKRA